MTLLLASLIDTTVFLVLALVIVWLLRRRAAALRHAVLAAAFVVAAATPVLEQALPSLPLISWPSSAAVTSSGAMWTDGDVAGVAGTADTFGDAQVRSWPELLLGIWLLGTVASAAGLVTGLIRLHRIARRSVPVDDGRWRIQTNTIARAWSIRRRIRLLQSAHPSLLVSYGVFRPTIVLPAGAEHWSDARIRVVLLHEIAHVRRHDAFMQLLAQGLRVVLWFNPVVWLACRALRHESECACDDAVLHERVGATDYATHLLDVARTASQPRYVYAAASAIAHPSTLERRITAVLNSQRSRTPLTRRGRLATAVAVLAIAIPLTAAGLAPEVSTATETKDVALVAAPREPAAVTRQASAPTTPASPVRAARVATTVAQAPQSPNVPNQNPGAVSGTISDHPAGGGLPGVAVMLVDTQFGDKRAATSDASGRFSFGELLPSRDELTTSLPGFRSVVVNMPVTAGTTTNRAFILPVGSLMETITVVCSPQQASLPARARGTERDWWSGHLAFFEHIHGVAFRIFRAIVPDVWAQEPVPIRVGGQIRAPRKVADVKPVCPAEGITGTGGIIIWKGRIGLDGDMLDVQTRRDFVAGDEPSAFANAAMDAVRGWRFTPTLLNGTPVEITMSVTVNFKR